VSKAARDPASGRGRSILAEDRRPIRYLRLPDTVFVTPRAVAAVILLVLAYLAVVQTSSLVPQIVPITPVSTGEPVCHAAELHGDPVRVHTLFALLPATYTQASLLYSVLQIVFFLAAVIVVGTVYRYPAFALVCLA